jgi:hypothetical protein
MPTQQEDIQQMAERISVEYGCRVEHSQVKRAAVKMNLLGKRPEFQVETFRLINHPTADTVFAWKWPLVQKRRDEPSGVIMRLKIGKIDSPVAAVSDWIATVI